MGKLNELGITVGTNNKAEKIFDSLFPDFMKVEYETPSQYVQQYWNAYCLNPERTNNLNGKNIRIYTCNFMYQGRYLTHFSECKSSFCSKC